MLTKLKKKKRHEREPSYVQGGIPLSLCRLPLVLPFFFFLSLLLVLLLLFSSIYKLLLCVVLCVSVIVVVVVRPPSPKIKKKDLLLFTSPTNTSPLPLFLSKIDRLALIPQLSFVLSCPTLATAAEAGGHASTSLLPFFLVFFRSATLTAYHTSLFLCSLFLLSLRHPYGI